MLASRGLKCHHADRKQHHWAFYAVRLLFTPVLNLKHFCQTVVFQKQRTFNSLWGSVVMFLVTFNHGFFSNERLGMVGMHVL